MDEPLLATQVDQNLRSGLKIEKPREQKISVFFNVLLTISFLLIAGILWVLALEYLHVPAPEWFRESVDKLTLIFS